MYNLSGHIKLRGKKKRYIRSNTKLVFIPFPHVHASSADDRLGAIPGRVIPNTLQMSVMATLVLRSVLRGCVLRLTGWCKYKGASSTGNLPMKCRDTISLKSSPINATFCQIVYFSQIVP